MKNKILRNNQNYKKNKQIKIINKYKLMTINNKKIT